MKIMWTLKQWRPEHLNYLSFLCSTCAVSICCAFHSSLTVHFGWLFHTNSLTCLAYGVHHHIIIIITNEEIKVTLSRKRCRGTLQDYDKGKISKCQSELWTNRNVFSWCLNGTRKETVRRDGGRLFMCTNTIMPFHSTHHMSCLSHPIHWFWCH